MKDILVTNNSDFIQDGLGFEVRYLDTLEYSDVLLAVRDLVHKGHRLMTHPLSGSVKPFETPYKSIVVSAARSETVDRDSLILISDAVMMAEKFRRERHFTDKLLADFRLIDRDLIERGRIN
ncbi:MAG: GrdX family protein [Bacillota bacterium]|nr:GrdX family protein [Bacillota bacterium]